MNHAEIVGAAAKRLERSLVRDPERQAPGPHEISEFAPALRDAMTAVLDHRVDDAEVVTGYSAPIGDWNRPRTQVDLVLLEHGQIAIAAELKVWDVSHQLFDAAKVCCLLRSGARSGFLLCIAETARTFGRRPGGELFPADVGGVHSDLFPDLLHRHERESRTHFRRSRPCPTALPRAFSATAITNPISLSAYPGHQLRVVELRIEDPTIVPVPTDLIGD